jgi:hypothetical protein
MHSADDALQLVDQLTRSVWQLDDLRRQEQQEAARADAHRQQLERQFLDEPLPPIDDTVDSSLQQHHPLRHPRPRVLHGGPSWVDLTLGQVALHAKSTAELQAILHRVNKRKEWAANRLACRKQALEQMNRSRTRKLGPCAHTHQLLKSLLFVCRSAEDAQELGQYLVLSMGKNFQRRIAEYKVVESALAPKNEAERQQLASMRTQEYAEEEIRQLANSVEKMTSDDNSKGDRCLC